MAFDDYLKRGRFTIANIFDSIIQEASPLLDSISVEKHGALAKYIEISKDLKIVSHPNNLSVDAFETQMDRFDDGLSRMYPSLYPYAMPLVRCQGELAYSNVILETFKKARDNIDKLDLSEYGWWANWFGKSWLQGMLSPRIDYLQWRIQQYQKSQEAQPQVPSAVLTWQYSQSFQSSTEPSVLPVDLSTRSSTQPKFGF